jgi:hypothetical protein
MMLFPDMAKPKPAHDPGGKVRIPLKRGVTGSAVFGGKANEYRYRLNRSWDCSKPVALFVLMNPSTADPAFDDSTVAKCCRFAQAWGIYGGIVVTNTFAYRCTDQKRLLEISDPIGPDNDRHIIEMAKQAAVVVFAYGKPKHKQLRSRGADLARLLIAKANVKPHILSLGKDGTPKHPLYLKETLKPVVWQLEHPPLSSQLLACQRPKDISAQRFII